MADESGDGTKKRDPALEEFSRKADALVERVIASNEALCALLERSIADPSDATSGEE